MGTTTVREIETKYAVDPELVLPPLDGVDGVAAVTLPEKALLDATYYDTGDLRLIRDRITLRRRTGGADEGWHLKLPIAVGERDEVRLPLNGYDGVPPELADLVGARIRGAELRPVARITTVRTTRELRGPGGEPLAEVADDKVQGRILDGETAPSPLSWREVEVELAADADRSILEKVGTALLAAGARPADIGSKLAHVLGERASADPDLPKPLTRLRPKTRAREVVRAYLVTQTEALLATDPAVRREEPDAVHQMRVASRRLRSALRTFRPLLDDGTDRERHLDAELKWLAGVLGEARDREVLLERLRDEVHALPPEVVLGTVAAKIDRVLLPELITARATVVDTLRGQRYADLLDALVAYAGDPPFTARSAQPAGDVLPKLVRHADRTLAARVAAIEAATSPEHRDVAFHHARKAAKRLRYTAESVAAVHGKPAKKLAKAAEGLQEVLGDHQDLVVLRGTLRRLGAGGGGNGFTFGLLLGQAQERAHDAERDFGGAWATASDEKLRRWLR